LGEPLPVRVFPGFFEKKVGGRGGWVSSLWDSVGIVGFAYPTLKLGANDCCAYGAGNGAHATWGLPQRLRKDL
jgi:hypothetical protein